MGINMKKPQTHSDRSKKYNSDKISVQILKTTHKKLKEYCIKNDVSMKDFLDELILKST